MPAPLTLLSLEPAENLSFKKNPQTTPSNRPLKLTNTSSGNVAFKVKTTAPKAYLVRPSSGTLRPKETCDVQIILQPQGSDGQTSNHRFLVQAVTVQSSDAVTREMWAEFSSEQVQESRLNVVMEEKETEQPSNAAPNQKLPSGGGDVPADLKVKYDELVQYTLMLEKEKKKLEADMATLQNKPGSASGVGGYSKLHVIAIALIAFVASYATKFLQ